MHKTPSFDYEDKLLNETADMVFGMDEVGRGSFAGPLVASAVCFEKKFKWFKEINDSKLLTHDKRKQLSKLILKNSIFLTEQINVDIINKSGIGNANKLIFQKLIKRIKDKYNSSNVYFLIDGRKIFESQNTEFIIKGDQKCISIAASSIIAKVYRDELMKKFEKEYKGYNFSKNKGYGTKFHQKALKKYGMSKIHRKSFNLNKYL
jgi:ribonuclease HII